MKNIKINMNFSIAEINKIIEGLSELKYKESVLLINKIQHESENQINEFIKKNEDK
ncbi:MAG: hypothetical protein ACOC2U_01030 [bacterium]